MRWEERLRQGNKTIGVIMAATDVVFLVCFVLTADVNRDAGFFCAFTVLEQKENPFVVITGLWLSCAQIASNTGLFVQSLLL